MTPCFIHTPNMTNNWNNFKPTPDTEDSDHKKDEEEADNSYGNSGDPLSTIGNPNAKKEKLFVETKQIKGIP
jgi:hypothetical protein